MIRKVLVPPARRRGDRRRRRRHAPRHRHGKGRKRALGSQIRGRRADRSRIHRAISATGARRRAPGNPRSVDGAGAGQGLAARAAAGRGGRRAAAGGGALSQSDADPAAVPARRVRRRRPRARVCSACWRARRTCRISPRSTRISPKRSRRCGRASSGSSGARRQREKSRRALRRAGARFPAATRGAHRRGARRDRPWCGAAGRNPGRGRWGPSPPAASCWRWSAAARTRC